MVVGNTPPQTYCCQNAANCTMARNSSWVCSSAYNNSVDKFRVCPYYPGQCGSSANLNLGGVGDTSCIRIKGLQQGNACFYNVKSRCGVPDFQLNDTQNVVIQYRMISNKTIANNSQGNSSNNGSQGSNNQTRNNTNGTSNNSTGGNGTRGNNTQGNQSSPAVVCQQNVNRSCQCQNLTDPVTKRQYLSCNCSDQLNITKNITTC